MTVSFFIKSSLVVALFLLLGLLLNQWIDQQWLQAMLHQSVLPGEVWFLLLGAVLASVGISRQALAFLGGYAFGLTEGLLVSSLATLAGCILTYLGARFLVRDYVLHHFTPRMQRIHRFMNRHTFSMTLLIRLLPFGSNVLVNVVAGATSIRPLAFFAGSGLGYIPQMLIFSLLGSGVAIDPSWEILAGTLLFLLSGVLGVYLYRRYRHDESLSDLVTS